MKKIFLFMTVAALAFTLNSCSSDSSGSSVDDDPVNEVRLTVNGVPKVFTVIDVDDVGDATDYSAFSSTNANEYVVFRLPDGATGDETDFWFGYTSEGSSHLFGPNGTAFTLNVEINNGSRVKGTFAGPMNFNEENLTVTNGSFDISY